MDESDHIWDQTNAPSQTLICNSEIEAALCLLSAFPRVVAFSLFKWVCPFDRQKKKEEKKR